jgi:hypothetical protein
VDYSLSELKAALYLIADERYFYRLVSPAIGDRECEAMTKWRLRTSVEMGGAPNIAAMKALEEQWAESPYNDPSRENADTFFSLLNYGWRRCDEGRYIRRAILKYFKKEEAAAKLFLARQSTGKFCSYVKNAANRRIRMPLGDFRLQPSGIREIKEMLNCIKSTYLNQNHLQALDDFMEFPKLAAEAKLVPTKYLSIVQEWHDHGVTNPISALIAECARYPNKIFNLSGRQFEHFVAEIFRAFDCEVELTAATRDGGRDIVCCRRKGSRGYRFAIETKRFAQHRKITVNLINQFLGANRKLDADRLLFVTTSNYTKPALKQAKDNIDILSVRNFNDVISWANLYSTHALGMADKRAKIDS